MSIKNNKKVISDEPPSRISNMARGYNFLVCYPIAPVHVYRVLFWYKADKEGVLCSSGADNLNYA